MREIGDITLLSWIVRNDKYTKIPTFKIKYMTCEKNKY